MLSGIGQPVPALPAGFAESHTKEMATCDDRAKFAKKDVYLELSAKMKDATLAAIDAIPESKLDEPGPEQMRDYAPTMQRVLTFRLPLADALRAVRRCPPKAGQAGDFLEAVSAVQGKRIGWDKIASSDRRPTIMQFSGR